MLDNKCSTECIAYTPKPDLLICEICNQTFFRGYSCSQKGHIRKPGLLETRGYCLKYNKDLKD